MSDAPYTDSHCGKILPEDGENCWSEELQIDPEGEYVHVDNVRKMERHLRRLLAMANCYVPVSVLKEVKDFLGDKASVN